MANTLISVRVPRFLEHDCRQLSEQLGYANTQELIREAIRDKVLELKRKIAWQHIKQMPLQKAKRVSKSKLAEYAKQ